MATEVMSKAEGVGRPEPTTSPHGEGKPMPDNGSTGAQLWGAAIVVAAALAVVAAYLLSGAGLVLGVAGVEVLLVMTYVARRFRLANGRGAWIRLPRGVRRPGGDRPDPAHCERCRRAHEALGARAAKRAGVAHAPVGSARDAVGHQRDAYVLHDERAEGEGVEDLVEPEPTR
ncbi:hypothetical protein [Kitasatospora sp. NBC_00315]|uniref:hypothetical protein n=1 Tax=Kitasatospora sp. NBC_00315 TaxID=2975963 RepID=UPI003253CC9A